VASKQTYPCFACRKAGHEVMVFLDGKDEQGRTKYMNEDGTKHTHLGSSQQQAQQQQQSLKSTNDVDLVLEIKLLHQKVDRILTLLEERLLSSPK
jgi:hypothetical protein